MRKNQSSLSAQGIAILRGIESEKPEDERICFDPYAKLLAPAWLYFVTRLIVRTGYAEIRGPGVGGFLVGRERYIDDYLSDRLKEGIDQVVILGAGYDSRPYRFDEMRKNVRAFEVDHPATQKDKLAILKKVFGAIPDWVTYVAIDFTVQSLGECLFQSGYKPQLKTVFIWQGVTYYLDQPAVEKTLDFVCQNSEPGSSIIFDYIDSSLLINPGRHGEIEGMRRYQGMTGEALTFGIPVNKVKSFLIEHGFNQIHNICSEDIKKLYFAGKNQSRKVASGYGIVSAFHTNS
jgi:methyltransferase (TIGR00027 family)